MDSAANNDLSPSKACVLPDINPSSLCTVCSLRSQTESLTAILLISDVGQLLMASKCFSSPYCPAVFDVVAAQTRSEEHTSELQSLMRISYAVFCLKKKTIRSQYHAEK